MSETRTRHSKTTKMRGLIREILLGLGSPTSHLLADLLVEESESADRQLIELAAPNPGRYTDWRDFYRDYASKAVVSKLPWLDAGVDKADVAIRKFLLCESTCLAMNVKFRHADVDPEMDSTVLQVFHLARRKISRVLGHFDWDEAVALSAFGPGAAVGLPRRSSHVVNKFGCLKPTVTGECVALVKALFRAFPHWHANAPEYSGSSEDRFEIVRGSYVTTVPKNSKTDRVIAVEPLLNMFFQKGIGACIRRRLRTVGVNLNDQTVNQRLALRGSIDGSLATIDLSSASDSISRGLVEWLVPEPWVTAMKICRSKFCVLPSGEEKFLQKFSSMGNGYTFELESLIFWAFASACVSLCGESARDLGVYGDDIIVPTRSSGLLIEVLSHAGFETNVDKTFVSGPFRESCGKHYFLGHDVTPMYVRKDLVQPLDFLWLLNSIRRLAHRLLGFGYGCDLGLRGAYAATLRSIPKEYKRLSIPDGYGDGGVVRDFDEARPGRHRCFDAYVTRHIVRTFRTSEWRCQPAITASLFFLERRFKPSPSRTSLPLPRRGDPPWLRNMKLLEGEEENVQSKMVLRRYDDKFVKLIVPRWEGLGPWLAGFSPPGH